VGVYDGIVRGPEDEGLLNILIHPPYHIRFGNTTIVVPALHPALLYPEEKVENNINLYIIYKSWLYLK